MVSDVHFWSLSSYTELICGVWGKDSMYMYMCTLETDSQRHRKQPFPQQKVMNNSTVENYTIISVTSSYRQTIAVPQCSITSCKDVSIEM